MNKRDIEKTFKHVLTATTPDVFEAIKLDEILQYDPPIIQKQRIVSPRAIATLMVASLLIVLGTIIGFNLPYQPASDGFTNEGALGESAPDTAYYYGPELRSDSEESEVETIVYYRAIVAATLLFERITDVGIVETPNHLLDIHMGALESLIAYPNEILITARYVEDTLYDKVATLEGLDMQKTAFEIEAKKNTSNQTGTVQTTHRLLEYTYIHAETTNIQISDENYSLDMTYTKAASSERFDYTITSLSEQLYVASLVLAEEITLTITFQNNTYTYSILRNEAHASVLFTIAFQKETDGIVVEEAVLVIEVDDVSVYTFDRYEDDDLMSTNEITRTFNQP